MSFRTECPAHLKLLHVEAYVNGWYSPKSWQQNSPCKSKTLHAGYNSSRRWEWLKYIAQCGMRQVSMTTKTEKSKQDTDQLVGSWARKSKMLDTNQVMIELHARLGTLGATLFRSDAHWTRVRNRILWQLRLISSFRGDICQKGYSRTITKMWSRDRTCRSWLKYFKLGWTDHWKSCIPNAGAIWQL